MLSSFLGNLAGVLVSPGCYSLVVLLCSVSLFPSCGFLALGVLNWSTAQVSSLFEASFVFFFALICGGEVRSLGEVGGLVPLRLLRTPSMRHCTPLPRWGIRRYV